MKMFWASVALFLLFHVNGASSCEARERNSLLQFKSSVLDPSNTLFNSWHGFNCCQWNGIQCHPQTRHVIRLDLHSSFDDGIYLHLRNRTEDVLSPLFNLEHLQHLDVSGNDFYGVPIPPGLDKLKSLGYLDLSWAGFMGDIPREVGNMSSLRYLDLSSSYGWLRMDEMQTWTGNMRHLRELKLNQVNMSRVQSNELDNALYTMNSLNLLQMSYCYLSGGFPSSILANLTNLTHLDLGMNYFDGSIPPALLSLPRLQHVDLFGNHDLGGKLSSILPQHSSSLHTLILSWTAVGGHIPDSVANISSLAVLHLSRCNVGGSLPITMANLTALEGLDVSDNMLRGHMPPFGNGSSHWGKPFPLVSIDLSYNQLDGPIPPMLFTAFPSLQSVDFSSNQLEGKIPPSIAQLSSLETFDIGINKLKGAIPLNISNLSELKNLYLQSNQLSGNFSDSHLFNLRRLLNVHISDNLLTIKFNPTWIPKFSLETLGLRSCNMEGGFPTFLITQYEVQFMDLSNNSLVGEIPQWIWGLGFLYNLNLSHNHFAGVLPCSLVGCHVLSLDLHNNSLQGQLPPFYNDLVMLDVSENQLSGSLPTKLGEDQSLKYLFLSQNYLNSSIPPSLLSKIRILDLSDNNLVGKIPACYGNSSIQILNLENNYLKGELQEQFANMPFLQTLKLGGNILNSYIPASLIKCKELEILDLKNNKMKGFIPNWIRQLSSLKVLILRSNRFEGRIPSEVTSLSFLQILDLSSNRFSGVIPVNITSLQALKNQTVGNDVFGGVGDGNGTTNALIYVDRETIINKAKEMEFARSLALVKCIDLSNNNLTGEIPPNIGLLEGLIILNVSRNNINGEIPKSLGEMRMLESLDLSNNQLFGNIPLELQSLTFLSSLQLSNNNLSGKIPQGGQFYTFEASSFSNNSDLCGLQLRTTCCNHHPCPPSIPPRTEADKVDEEDDDIWWGVGLGMSYAVGFSIVIGILCLTTTWSRKYFQVMDNIIIYLFERYIN